MFLEDLVMLKKIWLLALVVTAVLLSAAPVLADGDFYVIAGGGRAVGTAITPTTPLPLTISQPGFYYLTGNLTYSNTSGTANAITIAADEVTLDLMGFRITGPGANIGNDSTGHGIAVNSNVNNVEVRNGSVKNFYYAISAGYGASGSNYRLANLKTSGCKTGIVVNLNGGTITGCQSSNNNSYGFYTNGECNIIDRNIAYNNSTAGFFLPTGGIVTNNVAYSNGYGFELSGHDYQLVDHNSSYSNTTNNWFANAGVTKGLNTP
jgi:hypothetical protein